MYQTITGWQSFLMGRNTVWYQYAQNYDHQGRPVGNQYHTGKVAYGDAYPRT